MKHASINYCKQSPGPCYGPGTSLGKQALSSKRTTSAWGFGTADRFKHSMPDLSKAEESSPGPGAYDY